jgi:hypothetical protein
VSDLARRGLGTAVCAGVIVASAVLTAAPAHADSETCKEFTSGKAKLQICASLYNTPDGSTGALGSTLELKEALRVHTIVVELQQKNASGGWEKVAEANDEDREGAAAATEPRPADGKQVRACATGGVRSKEQTTVCTAE